MPRSNRATTYTSSKACRLAREWLEECETKHGICRKPVTISEFTLPRRLIDVGSPDSRAPFLIETATLEDKNCRYAALSHCWGDPSKLLQTLASNISEHYEEIPWAALPNTFQDAITVTRGLGLRYLWIDSLCIIQKNKTDFEHECASMHLIYLHCCVTIAASDSHNGTEGFLKFWDDFDQPASAATLPAPPSATSTPKPLALKTQIPVDEQAFRPPSSQFRHNRYIEWSEWSKVLDGPLNTRAWAYQERQLAPRILHYTRYGVMWECRQRIGAGDSRLLQLRRICVGLRWDRFFPSLNAFRVLDTDKSRQSLDEIMDLWLLNVEAYSQRQLSHPEDKLPALSGLAAAVVAMAEGSAAVEPHTYLAGIWLSHIQRQLFWCAGEPDEHDPGVPFWPPQEANSLPSWSWASYDGPVSFYPLGRLNEHAPYHHRYSRTELFKGEYTDTQNMRRCDRFEYLSKDISPAGADPFGAIQGNCLRIQGSFFDEDVSKMTECAQKNTYRLHCDDGLASVLYVLFDLIPPSFEGLTLRFLLLLKDNYLFCGIVLQATETRTFRKVGIFGIRTSDNRADLGWHLREMTLV
ncbi:HET-domain-containing protein [Trematosphaeria pertusa]|uniref:HET-domain-containing protein n=1 Tax=Trematosphaeria pertusa TaxID=390896 RepID=A0A6A6I1A6_9PLEO|nr:HET-domain-containing protein [Trematosphaeria pertusa]KAF2243929.1 HET-domain-containing protein [Trematosphaeria pertusa]